MCLLTEVFCPPRERTIIPCFFTFNILWNYQSGFRHTELKKPIVWSRIEKYFVNGSARPLTLPSTLNHGDSSLILFFLIAILSATLTAQLLFFSLLFVLPWPCSRLPAPMGNTGVLSLVVHLEMFADILSKLSWASKLFFFSVPLMPINCTYTRIKPPLKFSSSLKWIPARLYEDTFTFLVKSKLKSL